MFPAMPETIFSLSIAWRNIFAKLFFNFLLTFSRFFRHFFGQFFQFFLKVFLAPQMMSDGGCGDLSRVSKGANFWPEFSQPGAIVGRRSTNPSLGLPKRP